MLPVPFDNALVLTGPTGSGKTQFALDMAERIGAEIVSMDSMALYRGMDVGTAKPTPADRARVPHHLLDELDPWESSSVAWWLKRAAECCREIEARGKRVLFVGGTPLYLKALLCGLFDAPPADLDLRSRLEREASASGPAALHARLAQVDAPTAGRLHPNDVRRVVRALEVWELTGRPISSWQTQWSAATTDEPQPHSNGQRANVVWLELPRKELYERIDRRVEAMVANGLVDEVRQLRCLPQPLSREAAQALGYKEMFAHLDTALSLDETIRLVQKRSRNFAKRQITWFRHLPGCAAVSRELTADFYRPTID